MNVFWLMGLLVGSAVAGFWLWEHLRGENVGAARGILQGENLVPGMGLRAIVKRHMSDGQLDRVELQLRILLVAKIVKLDAAGAEEFARALEEAVAEVRKEA